MSKIVISLSKVNIADLLLGAEISIPPSMSRFDNLNEIVVKYDDYNDYCTVEEDCDDQFYD